jgi:hypothetical protein
MHTRHEDIEDWFGFSLKHLILILLGITLFGIYIGVLFYGENSLVALEDLEKEKSRLEKEAVYLRNDNQRLQKRYFELLQLTGD